MRLEAAAVGTTQPKPPRATAADVARRSSPSTEIDTRLLGMVVALLVIWIAFDVLSGREVPHLPQPLEPVGAERRRSRIMATGMVLIIVSRNIDLSVGSLLGFLGYTMAMVQTDGGSPCSVEPHDRRLGNTTGTRGSSRSPWASPSAPSSALLQGFIVAYVGVPAFIVTLGGYLVWRGLIFRVGRQAGPDPRPARQHLPATSAAPPSARSASGRAGSSPASCAPASCSASRMARRRRRRHDLGGAVDGHRRRVRRGRLRWPSCSAIWLIAVHVRVAGHRRTRRRRLPGAHPHRRHAADDATSPGAGASAATSTPTAATPRPPSSAASTPAARSCARSC